MDNTQLNRPDRDLLIQTATKSELGIADLKTDIAQVNTSIAELKGSLVSTFTGLESRIKIMETLGASVNVPEAIKMLNTHDRYINDQIASKKTLYAIMGAIGAIAGLLGAYGFKL